MQERPTWDDYFMGIAKIVATRGTCGRLQVGAVLVKDKRIISTGYNGAPPGMPHCGDDDHQMEHNHCIRTVHAEENCVLQAAVMGATSTTGTTLYTTASPCYYCFKALATAGVTRIVAGAEYRAPAVIDALKHVKIDFVFYQPSEAWTARLAEAFTAPLKDYVSKA